MPDVVRIIEQFSILTDQDKPTATLRVLKQGESMALEVKQTLSRLRA